MLCELLNGKNRHLDPSTEKFKDWDSPSRPQSNPYSFAVVHDKIWCNESRMRPDVPIRFDPKTESFQSWTTPNGVEIIRHVWVTRENQLLIHQSDPIELVL